MRNEKKREEEGRGEKRKMEVKKERRLIRKDKRGRGLTSTSGCLDNFSLWMSKKNCEQKKQLRRRL